jgi:hypothetical protein
LEFWQQAGAQAEATEQQAQAGAEDLLEFWLQMDEKALEQALVVELELLSNGGRSAHA